MKFWPDPVDNVLGGHRGGKARERSSSLCSIWKEIEPINIRQNEKMGNAISSIPNIKVFCKRVSYGYFQHGKNPKALIIGEHHNNQSHLDGQHEIMALAKPRTIMHELLFEQKMSDDIDEVEQVKRWAKEFNAVLRSLDVDKEQRDARIKDIEKIIKAGGLPKELEASVYGVLISRQMDDAWMAMNIREEIESNNSPVVAIVGAAHIRPYSLLHSVLQGKTAGLFLSPVDYIAICQDPEEMTEIRSRAHFFD